MSRDVGARYQTAADVARDLHAFLDGRAPAAATARTERTIPLVDGRTGETVTSIPARDGTVVALTVRDGRLHVVNPSPS
jgi:hypothetical protein